MTAKISNIARKLSYGIVASGAMAAAMPFTALAAEEQAGIDAILPQMDEFIPMLIAFLILWFILAKFGWPVFENMLTRRENTIKDALAKAEEARLASERAMAEHEDQLAEAKACRLS